MNDRTSVLLRVFNDDSDDREQLPCGECGELTAAYMGVALCSPCEHEQIRRAYESTPGVQVVSEPGAIRRVSQDVDTEKLLQLADLPDLPRHELDPELRAFVDGQLTRKDGEEPALGLLIYGETGTGKSCQAMQLGREWIQRRKRSALYRTEGELIDNLKQFETGENHRERSRLRQVSLLIIDDLGTQKQTEWAYGQWYELFDYRYRQNLPTILTTNHWLTDGQVAVAKSKGQHDAQRVEDLAHIDARIWRRIKSLCRSVLMEKRED